MSIKKECDMIKDLLPNYIEKLTSTTTNTYIEKHIENCQECAETLKSMNREMLGENICEEKKIDYLKKIKQKSKRLRKSIFITVMLLIILSLYVIIFIFPNYMWKKNEDGSINWFESLFNTDVNKSNDTYYIATKMIEDQEISENEKEYKKIIVVQINEDTNKCENFKYIMYGIKEECVREKVDNLNKLIINKNNEISNIQYNDNSYSYNKNIDTVGRDKEEILNEILIDDDDKIIEQY